MGSPQEIHLMLCMCLLLKNFLQFLFTQKEFQRFSLDIPHFFLNDLLLGNSSIPQLINVVANTESIVAYFMCRNWDSSRVHPKTH